MLKRPFLIFVVIVGVLIGSVISYIQSRSFAQLVRGVLTDSLPKNSGISVEFSEFGVNFFPPGVALKKPKITLREDNLAGLPAGSSVESERVDFKFLPFQMLTGNIRVHEVAIVQGVVNLNLDLKKLKSKKKKKKKKKRKRFAIHWDELLQLKIESVSLEETQVDLTLTHPDANVRFYANSVRLGQRSIRGGLGYEVLVDLKNLDADFKDRRGGRVVLESLVTEAYLNAIGVRIDTVSLRQSGVSLDLKGEIKGDVLSPKSLELTSEAKLKGSFLSILELVRMGFPDAGRKKGSLITDIARGDIAFDGKVSGNLVRFLETVNADGRLEARNIKYQQFETDYLLVDGSWDHDPNTRAGIISLNQAVLKSEKRARKGGEPGHGGHLEVGKFRFALGESDPVKIPIQFDDVHPHWVGAPVLEGIFALDYRMTGPANVTFTPQSKNKEWSVIADVDWKIQNFQWDNQRWKKDKPLSLILKTKKLGLQGAVEIGPNGIRPRDLKVDLPKTHFVVSGELGGKRSPGIRVAGPIDFSDFGTLAGIPISGAGKLGIHVHGVSGRTFIDFDTKLVDTQFLGLNFGTLTGELSLDEKYSHLYFKNTRVDQGKTTYFANGRLDVSSKNYADMKFNFKKGTMQDLFFIFDRLLAKQSWFPRSLVGGMTGEVSVKGVMSMNKINIDGKIRGSSWEFFGERFREVTLEGGYRKGNYVIDRAWTRKNRGLMQARLSYSKKGVFDWKFSTQKLRVSDFDYVASLDVPIRGAVSIVSEGKGTETDLKSETILGVNQVVVRGVSFPNSFLHVTSKKGNIRMKGAGFGSQAKINSVYSFIQGRSSQIDFELRDFDFSPLMLLTNPNLMTDENLMGRISGKVQARFKSGSIELATGEAELSQYRIRKTGVDFNLVRPVSVQMKNGNFNIDDLSVRGKQGLIVLNLKSKRAKIQGAITGNADLSFFEFLTSTVERADGIAKLNFGISGSLKKPKVLGSADLSGKEIKVRSLESPFENLSGKIDLKQNVLTVRNLQSDLAGGRVSGNGTITLNLSFYPELDLKVRMVDNKLKVYPFDSVQVRGLIAVDGKKSPYTVSGNINVSEALSTEKVLGGGSSRKILKTARFTPAASSQQDSGTLRFKLKIVVNADRGILIKNDLFDAELKARVTLVNLLSSPMILGDADLLSGKMKFKDREFDIESANIHFDSPTVMNPKFNMTAVTDLNNINIRLLASGRLNQYEIEFSSNPVLPESEILSLLALGFTSEDIQRLRSGNRSAVQQGEAASLVLHSLDFNRDLEDKTGLQVQLDESVDTQQGTSAFRPQVDDSATATPKIVIKRKIGKNVDVSVGSTVGVGTNIERDFNAEVKVNKNLSVIGVYNEFEGTDTDANRTSFGLDVKVQKRFK